MDTTHVQHWQGATMNPILWIGLAFLILLVLLFIMIMYFPPKNYDAGIIRFLASLCAGFAGGFLSGDALFSMKGKWGDGMDVAISGTSGIALFLVIWFFWKGVDKKLKGEKISMSIPASGGWNFKAVVENVAKSRGALVSFKGFTAAQLALPVKEGVIQSQDAAKAIQKVALLCDGLPSYSVAFQEDTYTVSAA